MVSCYRKRVPITAYELEAKPVSQMSVRNIKAGLPKKASVLRDLDWLDTCSSYFGWFPRQLYVVSDYGSPNKSA